MDATPAALSDLRIIDLTSYLPGPYSSMLLADFGASVVHVEPPSGEPSRHLPDRVGADSAWHAWLGRNKSSEPLDLKSAAGTRRFFELVVNADVIIEGFTPGVAARLGIDYEACAKVKPDIIYCSISGEGHRGAYAAFPGHDIGYSARSGALSQAMRADGSLSAVGLPLADMSAALHAAVGILIALHHRDRTGEGQNIDIGMLGAAIALAGPQLVKALADRPPRLGEDINLGGNPAYGTYRASDGKYISLGGIEPRFWHGVCAALQRPDLEELLAIDPASVRASLTEIFAAHDRSHWDEVLDPLRVCYAPVNDLTEVADDPHVRTADLIADVDSGGVRHRYPRTPIRMSRTPAHDRSPAPALPAG